jgi:hypothetical protein
MTGRNIPFVNGVKYVGVIFDKRITWRLAKALRTFIRIYSLFRSERISARTKLTLHKALIRSVITYACPVWEFEAESHPLKLQLCKIRFSTPLVISRGAHRFQICIWLFIYHTFMIT